MMKIRSIILVIALFVVIGGIPAMAAVTRQDLSCDTLTGGGTNPWALDRFVTLGATQDDDADSADYDALEDGDSCLVWNYANQRIYFYVYDADSAATDDGLFAIKPDYTEAVGTPTEYTGDARWVLVGTFSNVPTIVNKTANYTIQPHEALGNHVFTNLGATGAITFTLPDAVPGMRVGFRVYAAYIEYVDPNGTERILVLTDTNGDKIKSDTTQGSLIVLEAISATEWMRVSQIGSWVDDD